MPPPTQLKIEEVYLLLGEKDVIIFQLGTAFNKLSEEKVALEKEIEALKNGRLERTDKHVNVLPGPRPVEGDVSGRGNLVPGEPDEPPYGVHAMEPS
jgi:hypothetical protein